MAKLSVLTWLGNAAAVLFGRHGDVTQQAHDAGCSRQTAYDHATKVQQAIHDAQRPGPRREQLLPEVQQLRQQVQDLRQQLDHLRRQRDDRIDLGRPQQRRLAVSLFAMGLSLNQIADAFDLLRPRRPPKRSTIGHWVQEAQRRAGRVLEALDGRSRPLAEEMALDEIFFHGQPALVGVEPASMALLLCHRAKDRQAATWERALQPFTRLSYAVADAGKGLQAALRAIAHRRPQQGAPPLERGLDHFHTAQEAQRVLARRWRQVEARWAEAEAADAEVRQAKGQRQDARPAAARARAAWKRAAQVMARYDREAAAWQRARAALGLFTTEGRRNDPATAAEQVRAAWAELRGPEWSKVRGFLQDERTLTFLHRLQRQLAEAEPRPAVREALVRLWGLRREAGRRGDAAGGGGYRGAALVQEVVCRQLAADWEESYHRVARVLRGAVRASSCVECVNSVLRMQQGRHRQMSQGVLDLQRLYWNCRAFRSGRRRGRCPYEHLGLELPTYDFWEVLHCNPAELTQEVSSTRVAA
jgi:hypothetical protein